MQKRVNLKIKFRESFRPFAPAVLLEESDKWFAFKGASPYMLMTASVCDEHITEDQTQSALRFVDSPLFIPQREMGQFRSAIGAVTHIDRSARLQTVSEQDNPKFYQLISTFYQLTGVPLVLNTSFNVNKMPIVDSPADAWECFEQTEMDILVLENFIIER
jgi:carbamoyltransferase